MLAQLDQQLAPVRSAVDRTGTLLRVTGDLPGDITARVAKILEPMGYVALTEDAPGAVDRWFGADDVDELSQEEAHVLAFAWVQDLEAEGVIAEPQRLLEPMRAALLDAFRTAARTGVIEGMHVDQSMMLGVLEEPEASSVRRWLEGRLGRSDG